MNTDVILVHPEMDQIAVNGKMRKTLPWVLGAATVVVGTLLIRSWIRHSNNTRQIELDQQKKKSSATSAKSIALNLLPFATLFLKYWLTKNKKEKEVATA